MPLLFNKSSIVGSANDPYLVSPKGIKVQVPESRVSDLLKKGFILMDKSWAPSFIKKEVKEELSRDFPLPMEELKKEVVKDVDALEVTEI